MHRHTGLTPMACSRAGPAAERDCVGLLGLQHGPHRSEFDTSNFQSLHQHIVSIYVVLDLFIVLGCNSGFVFSKGGEGHAAEDDAAATMGKVLAV